MQQFPHTIIILAVILCTQSISPTYGQITHANTTEHGSVLREDRVKADLASPAKRKDTKAYYRTVHSSEEGFHKVVIRDGYGQLRMTGSYLDQDLGIADGTFTYYYPNGQIESTGYFDHGSKSGLWERYHADGSSRAERIYSGKSWEELINQPPEEASKEIFD